MVVELEYDLLVRRPIPARVALLAVGLLVLVLAATTQAQVNGVPASVTSLGFGGHFSSAPGVPAGVTSPGFRSQGKSPFFNEPACCINPLFPLNPNPPVFTHRHHRHLPFFPVATPVYALPYSPGLVAQPGVDDSMDEEDYNGGPTIFDRRGSGQFRSISEGRYSPRAHGDERQMGPTSEPDAQAAATPVENQPATVLVFKDGHQVEVQNYAILGSTLYDLTPGHRHKIALAELNLAATAKQNDDRGIDFQLPAGWETN